MWFSSVLLTQQATVDPKHAQKYDSRALDTFSNSRTLALGRLKLPQHRLAHSHLASWL